MNNEQKILDTVQELKTELKIIKKDISIVRSDVASLKGDKVNIYQLDVVSTRVENLEARQKKNEENLSWVIKIVISTVLVAVLGTVLVSRTGGL